MHDRSTTLDSLEDAEREAPGGLVGEVLDGRFRVDRLIGAGGMGEVYLAHQLNVERNVAIKVLRRERLADEEAVERFLGEARTISRLTSPHTVTVLDVGELSAGDYFIAMEFLEGRTLRDRLDEGPVAPVEAARILDAIALSLAEAHAHRIVHRDLKPLNVLLGRVAGHAEIVKVVDFGLATIGRTDEETGRAGTPRYMAPETIRGLAVGPRADVYALGLIAYEMFAGAHPFEALSGAELLEAHLRQDVPPIDALAEGELPRAARKLVSRCLAKPPKLRPADAGVFRQQLRRAFGLSQDTATALAESDVEALVTRAELETKATVPSTTTVESPVDRDRVRPTWRWGAVGVALAAVGAWLLWSEPSPPAPAASARDADASPSATSSVAAPTSVTVLVHSQPEGAIVWLRGKPRGTTPLNLHLPEGRPVEVELRLDDHAAAHLRVVPADGVKVRHVFHRAERPPPPPRPTAVVAPAPPPLRTSPSAPSPAPVPDPHDKVDAYLD